MYIYHPMLTATQEEENGNYGGRVVLCLSDGVADVGLFDEFETYDDGVDGSQVIPYSSLCRCPVVQLYFLRR